MVDIKSFTCSSLIVTETEILQGLIEGLMCDFLQCEQNLIFPIETYGTH